MLNEITIKNKLLMWGIVYWIALTSSFVCLFQVRLSTFPIDFSMVKYVVATITVITMLAVIPNDDSAVGFSIIIILYMVVFPIAAMYACYNRESWYYISVFFCIIVVEWFMSHVSTKLVRLRCGDKNLSQIVIALSLVILGLTVFVMYIERGAPSLLSLDFSMTYLIRSSYVLSSFASGLFQVTTKAIIPFLIAVCFIKKKYRIVCILLLIQFLFFLWLANKTTLFSIGVFAFGYLIGKSKHSGLMFSKVMSLGMIGISILQGYNIEGEAGLSRIIAYAYSIIVGRAIILPAYLKYSYYDYFVNLENSREWLFGTFFGPFLTRLGIHNPYETVPYTKLIGNNYYLVGSNANTGLFGAELAHFGYLGIYIAGLLLILFLFCIKRCELTNGKAFTCCLTIYTVSSLADAGIIRLIDFSPMFVIALIAYFYEISEHAMETERKKEVGVSHKRIRFKLWGHNGRDVNVNNKV